MAPEQFLGRTLTPATDIYALGVTTYEMLFGTPPNAGSLLEIASRVFAGVDVPSDPAIPSTIGALLREMLSVDPDKRPSSSEVARRLREFIGRVSAGARVDQEALGVTGEMVAPGAAPASAPPAPVRAAPAPAPTPPAPVPSPAPPRAHRRQPFWALGAGLGVMLLVVAGLLVTGSPGWLSGVLEGIALIAIGMLVGVWITRRLARRANVLEIDATRMLHGSDDPGHLRADVVVEIRAFIARSKEIDERLLGVTIVGMMEEYERAEASADRQAALLSAVELFEKLRTRLSPWYVRYRRQLAAIPATASTVLGCVKIALELRKIVQG
jgi:hypothetical protein